MRIVPIAKLEEVLDELGGSARLARDIIYLSAKGMRIRYAGKGVKISKNHVAKLQTLGLDYVFLKDPFCEVDVEFLLDEDSRVGLRSMLFDFQIRCSVVLDMYFSERNREVLDCEFRDFWQRYSKLSLAQMTRYKKILQDLVYVIRSNYTQKKVSALPYLYDEDTFLYNHPINVAIIAGILALHCGEFNAERMHHLVSGAVLHDVGLIESVFVKKHEFADFLFFKHPRIGCMLINETELLSPLMGIIALEHHRYLNNTGWPDDIPEKDFYGYPRQMHLYSRIVSVAEAFEVLRNFYSPYKVVQALDSLRDELFEGRILDLLRRYVSYYYKGELVELVSGEKGIILEIKANPEEYTILLIKDSAGKRLSSGKLVYCKDPENQIKSKVYMQDAKLKARLLSLVSPTIISILEGTG